MFCPTCGTQAQLPDQSFCKVCGTNLTAFASALQPVPGSASNDLAAMLAEQLTALQQAKDQALRNKLRRAGWGLITGGPLLAAALGISSSVLENVSHWLSRFVSSFSGFGGLMLFAGILLLVYARMAFKKEPAPQVVVVAAPLPGATGTLPFGQAAALKAAPPYRSAFQAPATVAEPPSVTEPTTELLDNPYRQPPQAL